MTMNNPVKIILLAESQNRDDNGIAHTTTAETEIFAEMQSVSRDEFMSAGQIGLRPQYKFIIWAWEYDDQEKISYNGKTYTVYRTYHNDLDHIELYVERKASDTR